MEKTKSLKEPLMHISKRNDMKPLKTWIIRLSSGLIALLVCGIVASFFTKDFGGFYKELFVGAFGTSVKFWEFFKNMVILLAISLALAPAFKMKYWNIGAEGQVLIGCLCSAACMFYIKDSIPNGLLVFVMFICSVLGGLIWAVIPALFKAKWGTNETLFTLMMNYIAIKLVSYFISKWATDGSGVLGLLPYGHMPAIGGNNYVLDILIVAVLTVLVFLYMKYSKHGYEISVVGGSVNTAKYIGINVKKVIVRTMILSGAICGVAGFIITSGDAYTLTPTIVDSRGFTAILVCWLAQFNPFGMIIISSLVAFLERGGSQVVMIYQLGPDAFADILTGIFFFFIIGSEFFINYKINFNKKVKKPVESENVSVQTITSDDKQENINEEKEPVVEEKTEVKE